MIGAAEFQIGVFCGALLIALGLVPGVFQTLTEIVSNATRQLPSMMPVQPQRQRVTEVHQPRCLALVGLALIAFTVLAYNLQSL